MVLSTFTDFVSICWINVSTDWSLSKISIYWVQKPMERFKKIIRINVTLQVFFVMCTIESLKMNGPSSLSRIENERTVLNCSRRTDLQFQKDHE